MQRASGNVISGWAAILLMPILLPLGVVARFWPGKKTVDRTPAEVAGFLRDFLDGTSGDWDWDEFECVPITDPELDAIRQRAALVAPPNPDIARLRELLAEAEALMRRRAEMG
jgi:hypothetical protein